MRIEVETLELAAHVGEALTGFTLFVLILAYLHDRRRQDVQAFLYLHFYLTRDQYSAARLWVRTKLPEKTKAEWEDAMKWAEEERAHANNVCASFDQAGILIMTGVIARHLKNVFLKSSWGESVHHQHKALVPYLNTYVAERDGQKITGHQFFKHFGELSKLAEEEERRRGAGS